KDHISPDFAGVVLTDMRMPGKDGFAVLEYAKQTDPELPVILLTGEGDIPMALRAVAEGAFAFLEKPCAPKELIAVLSKAMQTRALVLENRRLKKQVETGDAASRMLLGESEAAYALRARVRAVANTSAEVLVHGEPGTGISKVAEVIHLLSGAAMRAFQKVPAASLDVPALMELYSQVEGGTLFLDEIANLSPACQFALLEALDQGAGTRLIAGSYRDLNKEVTESRFHPDLFLKLDAMRVRIPSLRERTSDIPILFQQYVANTCEQAALPLPDIPQELTTKLMTQEWPGNARALMNVAMRFAMGIDDTGNGGQSGLGLVDQMTQVERSLLIAALKRNQGNATEAARDLKLPRKTFYDKLAKHDLRPESFR
ncbi:MAG TPA: sigma 54-interacting transcriptional regulator, partial [Paracoccaceae bacterium]|nr:sigma 54-interacting transcriptional regulator [Paracoccaceae bacterium]